METLSPSKQEKLAALRRSFVGRLPGMVSDVRTACTALLGGTPDPESMTLAVRGAHTLAGTAGTYGLAEVSAVARSLEDLLRPVQAGAGALDETAACAVIDHLARLGAAVERA